ncbi:MAG: methylmalonyl Co-A mutase-associated GTPase MeaB [Proteobacteria bacterium]|nr:methylmalonyl Co-A mutase-associated GTPase MeaB [Pseudomonadota bacterium]
MIKKRAELTTDQYVRGVTGGDRTVLARTITLIESNARKHQELAQQVLKEILPFTGRSIRLGITGIPGAGKSTFIDIFGSHLCKKGNKVAVLAVDPSSSITKGSILGDKTRMEKLSQLENCFIRPSPSGGTLGGVARKTRETLLVCEAAGFDVILIETVGVGQSEALVSTMVDFFLLITLTGAGDELQSFKKGVIEMADMILINKADGTNLLPAQKFKAEFNNALHYLASPTKGWETRAYCCSALKDEGIDDVWLRLLEYKKLTEKSGVFEERRQQQLLNWLHDMLGERLRSLFFENPRISESLRSYEKKIVKGDLPVTTAVENLLSEFTK